MMIMAYINNIQARGKDHENNNNEGQEINPADRNLFERIVQCFSMPDNINLITSTGKSSNAVPVIDGLK